MTDVVRFVVSPALLDELRRVLHRDKFRPYLTQEEAELLVDAIEGASDLVPDPQHVGQLSPDPRDDYLIALALSEDVDGIISGDRDLVVSGGPRVLRPHDLLNLLQLTDSQRTLLVTSLWNLELRIRGIHSNDPRFGLLREALLTATEKLGGDPKTPLFNSPRLRRTRVNLGDLSREERAICGYSIALDRQLSGQLSAEHARGIDELTKAFLVSDLYTDIERLLAPPMEED